MAAAKNKNDAPETSRATNDAYTGMLVISLLALLAGGVLLFLDYNQYPDKKPPAVPKVAVEGSFPKDGAPAPEVKGKEKG
jgi:hypothetical protein